MAMTYNVQDIRNFGTDCIVIEAKSPLEAAQKAFPDYKVTRDYTNTGDVVVGRSTEQWYGRGYRTYVYNLSKI